MTVTKGERDVDRPVEATAHYRLWVPQTAVDHGTWPGLWPTGVGRFGFVPVGRPVLTMVGLGPGQEWYLVGYVRPRD